MKQRFVHLDFLRGLAALLVVMEHLSAFLFFPYGQLKSGGFILQLFYFITHLGHQAVIVFFVLSGFLVGGSILTSLKNGTWTWSGYLLRRLSRLWIVLIPALLLTLFWDRLGYGIAPDGYDGAFREVYHSGPTVLSPVDLSLKSLFGNIFFLQTIRVPVFGTNGPLWSLANEFWYYLLFPIFLGIFFRKVGYYKIIYVILFSFIIYFLPSTILLLGFSWILGVISYILVQSKKFSSLARGTIYLFSSLFIVMIVLALSRAGKLGETFDYLLALSIMIFFPALAVRVCHPGHYASLSIAASEFSYTLYLVHLPPLAFLFFTVFEGKQLVPSLLSFGLFFSLLVGVIIYSVIIWWIFERNTDSVRKWIHARF